MYEEYKLRSHRGEKLKPPAGPSDDSDSASIDEAKYRAKSSFEAGLFASYHVYPYYPDFLVLDPQYLKARDQQGPDPMFAYLRELRAHIPLPLIVTEYGIPNSMGISHFQPYGWNHGGHTEQEQAQILGQMSSAMHEAGCAGGIVFELQDEWYKHNWLTVDFEAPLERSALWQNQLDPEKSYGLIGYRTRNWKLFTGDDAAWEKARTIYGDVQRVFQAADDSPRIRSVQAAADESFLYLRLNLSCEDCSKNIRKNAASPLGKGAYALAIQTMPGNAGLRQMPFDVSLTAGANFLLLLSNPASSRLLVAANYNPYQIVPTDGVPNQTEIIYKRDFATKLQDKGSFEELVVETNRRRIGRDGTVYPAQRYSRSLLRYGNDSLAEWFVAPTGKAIVVRLAWGKLLVTSPSDHQVFAGVDHSLKVRTAYSPGIELSAFELQADGAQDDPATMNLVASAPALVGRSTLPPAIFNWDRWDSVAPEPYFKKAYYAIQKMFLADNPPQPANRGIAVRAGSRHRRQRPRPQAAAVSPAPAGQ
jgi:hypothetical protein